MTFRNSAVSSLFLLFAVTLLAGCSAGSTGPASTPPSNPTSASNPAPLSSTNVNLIFVPSEDLAYSATGDMNLKTANLTNQGLQRSLQTATFLEQDVLGTQNVSEIYALEPTTHMQTSETNNSYPDMVGLESIQQFALLNQQTMSSDAAGLSPYTGQSFAINASYSAASLPSRFPAPAQYCTNCQGLDFNDEQSDNEALVTSILQANAPGFYVFSAPWETASTLMANINKLEGYNLAVPTAYVSPNSIYAISVTPKGSASLATYDSQVNPPSTYPVLPQTLASAPCYAQTPFVVAVINGQNGMSAPPGGNTNETVYFIRHADAHPFPFWDNNNYLGAGQWRALDLPNTPLANLNPTQVYSIDPGQYGPGSLLYTSADFPVYPFVDAYSTVAPALTVEPYAIAKGVPYNLVTNFELANDATGESTSNFFFNNNQFNNQTLVVAWAFQFIQPTIDSLLTSYSATALKSQVSAWPYTDYDTIWTVQIDTKGNLTVSNATCEGIASNSLPAAPPQF